MMPCDLKLSKGLIIADPWIGYILEGDKTWEMRSRRCSYRGWFSLIRKGTGAVFGVARLVDSGHPLSRDEMISAIEKHRIPESEVLSGAVDCWNIPWIISDVTKLDTPIPYRHKNGAVTWVEIAPDVSHRIIGQLNARMAKASTPGQSASGPNENARELDELCAPNGALIGETELTPGNIENHHIYLRSFFDGFPDDAIGGSNKTMRAEREISVDYGGDAPILTDLDGTKMIFRARGWIRQFFIDTEAELGDRVRVEEVGPYRYRVQLLKPDTDL